MDANQYVPQGCCNSTSRSADVSPPYANQPHATSSTPIAANSSTSPRASTTSHSPGPTHRRHLRPAERFNSPLRLHEWKSKHRWTPSSLQREREAFFDTRVTGSPEIWNGLRMTIELVRSGDIETAQGIIIAADITVPTGDLAEGVYDQAGQYYQLPEFVVADPTNMFQDEPVSLQKGTADGEGTAHLETIQGADAQKEVKKEEKGKGKAPKKGSGVKVKARLSDRAKDVVVWISKEETVQSVIERVKEESQIIFKLRLAYMGKMLKENEPLMAQGFKEGHVVNALVFEHSPSS
ncbi:MAG: hypothetical protein LQ340_003411 [Diploschistes diacapsis]|nr:MAG: hypothetical protein LQ340_003411 [Diploschistes diacapsis]